MKLVQVSAICATLALGTATAFGGQKKIHGDYYSPKLRDGEVAIKRVVVLPPTIQVEKNTMKGMQSMETETAKLEPVVDRAVMRALQDNNVTVSDATPTEARLAANPQERESVAGAQREFDTVSPALLRRIKDVKKGRFKIDQDLPNFKDNDGVKADTLVFVRGYGQTMTRSKRFAKGGGAISFLIKPRLDMNMVITFVNVNTGEVLWVKAFFVQVKDDFTETKLTDSLDDAFKKDAKKGVFGRA